MNQFLITYSIDLLFSCLFKCLSPFITYLFTHFCIFLSWWMSLAKLPKSDRCKKTIWLRNTRLRQMWRYPGWYRFQGAAGTKMVTTCPLEFRCDTAYPIWLSGSHPTVGEGTVTRNVCIRTFRGCCAKQVSIQVKNCGSYYIYRLGNPGHCDVRYCSTD